MARLTVRLRVARLAKSFLILGQVPVFSQEQRVVPQEGHRERLFEIDPLVTGRASALFPLLLVLMTGETLTHGWERRYALGDHPFVTRDALPRDVFHLKVRVVIEKDLPIRAEGRLLEESIHLRRFLLMTAAAEFD